MDGQELRTPDDIFNDYKRRREALQKALTTQSDIFFKLCDPERENVALFGFPDGQWEVSAPTEEVPPRLPEPTLGINFSRDSMSRKEWLGLIAMHSDAWLSSIASYFAARYGFSQVARAELFRLKNDIPTLTDIVSKENMHGSAKKQSKENICEEDASAKKQKVEGSGSKMSKGKGKAEDNLCSGCGERGDSVRRSWVACDFCEKWYHCACVSLSVDEAAYIKKYKCGFCLVEGFVQE